MAKGRVAINVDRCKGCGLCVHVCPPHILEMSLDSFNAKGYHPVTVVSPENCLGCGSCAMICPDVVFTVFRSVNRIQAVPAN